MGLEMGKMEAESAVSVAGLKRALECPICFETPKAGPLYQCENGHILCSGCIEKVQECPQCLTKLPATKIRCLLGEQQLEWLPKKCKYSTNGCDFEQMPSRKQIFIEHETECLHRDVVCQHCSNNVALTKLLIHLKTAPHKDPFEVIGGEFTNDLIISRESLQSNRKISWVSTHFTLNSEKEFYFECVRNKLGFFFLWVYIIGTPKEEEHFTYTISVFDINNKENYRTGKGNVISIDFSWKIICSVQSDKMAGLIIPDALVKKFGHNLSDANEEFKLPYTVKIESVRNNSTKRKRTED